jgi:hypothetical protein
MTMHCRMHVPMVVENAATSTRPEYKLLFKGGRRLLTKMVAILNVIYALYMPNL